MSLSRGSLPDPDQPALMCGRVTLIRAESTARGHNRRSGQQRLELQVREPEGG